jgi:hypothetical protein
MKNWISKNYKTLIIAAFLVPIITVAIVSISHVTIWYGISNPVSWALYLSIGIEIAALSALAAISADMGKKVYFPFAIVTLVQFIGNIFFAYSFIDINSQSFKDWVDLVAPLLEFMGVEATNLVGHKRFLALFAGGMLPMISLSFLHMLVKFTEEDRAKEEKAPSVDKQIQDNIINGDLADESARLKLTEKDLEILQRFFENPPEPNDALKAAAKKYKENVSTIPDDQSKVKETPSKERIDEVLSEMMRLDEELGLYDEPFDNPLIKTEATPSLSDEEVKDMVMDEWERKFDDNEDEDWGGLSNEELIGNDEIPNVVEKTQLEKLEEYVNPQTEVVETILQEEPTIEEEEQNFSTIEENSENISQDNIEDYEGQVNEWEEETVPEPFTTIEEVQKYNIDDSIPREEEFQEINNDSFWRDHIQEDEDDDLKKKS